MAKLFLCRSMSVNKWVDQQNPKMPLWESLVFLCGFVKSWESYRCGKHVISSISLCTQSHHHKSSRVWQVSLLRFLSVATSILKKSITHTEHLLTEVCYHAFSDWLKSLYMQGARGQGVFLEKVCYLETDRMDFLNTVAEATPLFRCDFYKMQVLICVCYTSVLIFSLYFFAQYLSVTFILSK